jgi:hypothetical protein
MQDSNGAFITRVAWRWRNTDETAGDGAELLVLEKSAKVYEAVATVVLPRLYYILDTLLSHEGEAFPKDVKAAARAVLPKWCDNAFK